MLRDICLKYTDLSDSDIKILEDLKKNISYYSELFSADIFIDCFVKDSEDAVVVAHEKPSEGTIYSSDMTGLIVHPENEPMVFHSMKKGVAMRDEKAFTPEKKYVSQRTVPVFNEQGLVIAVLIQESDVTGSVRDKQKIKEMGSVAEQLSSRLMIAENREGAAANRRLSDGIDSDVVFKEMHHRVKNNLQIVSSMMAMKARRCESDEGRNALGESINMVNGIAAIEEMLINQGSSDVCLNELAEKLSEFFREYISGLGKNISVSVEGDRVMVRQEIVMSVGIIINELVTNAVQHAFEGRESGAVTISMKKMNRYNSVIVSDNGIGFSNDGNSVGLRLMQGIAEEKLGSRLDIRSGENGTDISFEFI